jgi:hypothetical protein
MEDFLKNDNILFFEIPTNHTNKWKGINHKNYIPIDFLF